ncbi:MAG: Holliday junction resolvase RuvX [Dehalococcoidia bacterium]|nr:Holliday junction resolvase RuvX [Dehalococcoidia bacterium]
MRAMGLDVGERRIGVALSDPEGRIAFSLTTVQRKSDEDAFAEITRLARENEVETMVVGLPRSLDGSLGRQAEAVLVFAETLKERVGVPVVTWDERMSTLAAERMLIEAGAKRGKRKLVRDSLAATYILQGYLDWSRRDERGQD